MKRPILLAVLAGTWTVACGESASEVSQPDPSGTWQYAAQSITGGHVTCEILGATLVLARQDGVVDGTISGARFTCSTLPDTVTFDAAVVDGRLLGDSLSFRFDTPTLDWRHQGRIMADSIGGTLTLRQTICDPGPCGAPLVGMWSGKRVE